MTSLGLHLDARFLRDGGLGTLAGGVLLALSALLVWLGDGFHLERALAPEGAASVVWKIVRTLLPLAPPGPGGRAGAGASYFRPIPKNRATSWLE